MRALCGRVRTVVLLPFPWYYTTSSAACQYYFEKFFDLFSLFSSNRFLLFCTTFLRSACRCTTFCRMTQMSLTKCIKKHYKSRGYFLTVMCFDEIYRQYSSILIIYKSSKMRYNSQAVVCESPRPVMPAFSWHNTSLPRNIKLMIFFPAAADTVVPLFLCFFRRNRVTNIYKL